MTVDEEILAGKKGRMVKLVRVAVREKEKEQNHPPLQVY